MSYGSPSAGQTVRHKSTRLTQDGEKVPRQRIYLLAVVPGWGRRNHDMTGVKLDRFTMTELGECYVFRR